MGGYLKWNGTTISTLAFVPIRQYYAQTVQYATPQCNAMLILLP